MSESLGTDASGVRILSKLRFLLGSGASVRLHLTSYSDVLATSLDAMGMLPRNQYRLEDPFIVARHISGAACVRSASRNFSCLHPFSYAYSRVFA